MTGWYVAIALYVLGAVSTALVFTEEDYGPEHWRFRTWVGVLAWPVIVIGACLAAFGEFAMDAPETPEKPRDGGAP